MDDGFLAVAAVPRAVSEERLALPSGLDCTDIEQRFDGIFESLLAPVVAREMKGPRLPEEKLRPFGVVLGPKLERVFVERRSGCMIVQPPSPIARNTQAGLAGVPASLAKPLASAPTSLSGGRSAVIAAKVDVVKNRPL